jgi:hypothetical protein
LLPENIYNGNTAEKKVCFIWKGKVKARETLYYNGFEQKQAQVGIRKRRRKLAVRTSDEPVIFDWSNDSDSKAIVRRVISAIVASIKN